MFNGPMLIAGIGAFALGAVIVAQPPHALQKRVALGEFMAGGILLAIASFFSTSWLEGLSLELGVFIAGISNALLVSEYESERSTINVSVLSGWGLGLLLSAAIVTQSLDLKHWV